MDILKPDFLSLTSQPLDWQGKMHHALTVGFGFSLVDGAPLKADEAWGAAMQGLASGFCVDTGVPKKQAEWLLSGAVCAPQSSKSAQAQPVRGLLASCSVGKSRREWLACGERKGNDTTPFMEMPLIWANTWGSPSSTENPLGCGVEPDATGSVRPPTITEKDIFTCRPTCPGSMGPWPCRMKNMGTYDAKWLQERWPGVPDDFDWEFFNLAQPAQRLPEGLHGGEPLELLNLHPVASRLTLHAPVHQIRVEILRSGESDWRELSAARDTLWLFPGVLTGLYLWHALAPCKDEAASDISAVRLTLTPEIAMAAPPPGAGAAGVAGAGAAGVAGAGAAGAAGVADAAGATGAGIAGNIAAVAAVAGLGAALLAGASSPSMAAEQQTAPSTDPQAPAEQAPPEQAPAEQAPAEQAPAEQAPTEQAPAEQAPTEQEKPDLEAAATVPPAAYMETVKAEALAELDTSVEEINAGLREAGLPPITPEQLQETRERIAAMTGAVGNLLDTPQQSMEDVLRQAGLPEERIAAVNTVLELPLPSAADYADAASWSAASEAFAAQFAALMQPSAGVLNSLRQGFSFAGPDGQAAIEKALGAQPSTDEVLARTGIDPQLLRAELDRLDQEDLPGLNDMNGLSARAVELELALGLPPESMTTHIDRFARFMRDRNLLPPQVTPLPPLDATSPIQRELPEPLATEPSTTGQATTEPSTAGQATAEQGSDPAPQSREDVLLLLAVGVPLAGLVFAGLSLEGMDFSNRDLRGATFDNAKLDSANFTGSDITGGSFAGTDLSNANFAGATLAQASFAGASAVDATFSGALLAGAVLAGANMYGADFCGADMKGVQAAQSVLDRASFVNTNLSDANFAAASFTRADFHAANAEKAVFAKADMTNASLGFGTSVAGADFSGACLRGGAWDGVNARNGTFTGVMADNAAFVECDFSDASWKAARAREADFSRARLDNTDMRGADLFKASLRESGAETANFSGANLYNADLYRLRTSPLTNLNGADINATIVAARKIPF